MPAAPIKLPDDVRVTAYRGVIEKIRKDPDLARVVKTFKAWDGKPGDGTDPASADCPWIRVGATPMESAWFQNADDGSPVMKQPIRLVIETAVSGTNTDDSARLWGAIEKAIYRGGTKALNAVGVSGAEVKQPGWGDVQAGESAGADMVQGVGVVVLTVYVEAKGATDG